MGYPGDIRDTMEWLHGLMPMSNKELDIAEGCLEFYSDAESPIDEVLSEPEWYGEKCVAVAKKLREGNNE